MSRDYDSCVQPVLALTTETDTRQSGNLTYLFGDMLKPKDTKHILCVPAFADGFLFKSIQKNLVSKQEIVLDNELEAYQKKNSIQIFSSANENCSFIVLFKYSRNITEWNEIFDCIGSMLSMLLKDDIQNYDLYFPTFGTNNGITFHDTAFGIFYGLSFVQSIPEHPITKFKGVKVITPYSQNIQNTSCRTMLHIFNMFDTYAKSKDSTLSCMLCLDSPSTIILPCGHAILCQPCNKKLLSHGNNACIVCKTPFAKFFESVAPTKVQCVCHKQEEYASASASADNQDSDKHNEKVSEMTYIPCGHTDVLCATCENPSIINCKFCGEKVNKKIHIYSF